MAKHANIPHEIVWGLRRKMQYALMVVKDLEEALQNFGENPNPRELENSITKILARFEDTRPEMDMMVNLLEGSVRRYIGGHIVSKKEITFSEMLDEVSRYKRSLTETIEHLDYFEEGKTID